MKYLLLIIIAILFQLNVNAVVAKPSVKPTYIKKIITKTPIDTKPCLINPVQAICQTPVLINNVRTTKLGNSSIKICWDTNIETKGAVRYGEAEKGLYFFSTDVEAEYLLLDHCVTLNDLEFDTEYVYSITSNSFVGKSKDFSGVISTSTTENINNTRNLKPVGCMQVTPNSYSFNSLNQANIIFKTKTISECKIQYGNYSTREENDSKVSTGLEHEIYIDLQKLDGTSDLYYQIECKSTNDNVDMLCEYNDFIPINKYKPYVDYSKFNQRIDDNSYIFAIISISLISIIIIFIVINTIYNRLKKKKK